MEISVSQARVLLAIEKLDRRIAKNSYALSQLDQPKKAAEIRSKMEDIAKKMAQIRKMEEGKQAEIARAQTLLETLSQSVSDLQMELERSQGDFRKVEALSKQLESLAAKQLQAEEEIEAHKGELGEARALYESAQSAQDSFAHAEAKLAQEYREVGGAYKREIDAASAEKEVLLGELGDELLQEYCRVSKRCGAIAIATFEGGSCSACRNSIDANHELKMRQSGPVATCPNCGRLVVMA